MTESGVSIIIPIFNGIQHLERLLATFFKINTYQPFELIIIDHSSTGGAAQVVSEYITRAFIRLINSSHNQSFSAACNLGASKARYPYLLFLDAGIVYTSDVLPTALAKLADPAIGVVGVRLDDDPVLLSGGHEARMLHAGIQFVWNERHGYYQPEQIQQTLEKAQLATSKVPAVIGAFLFCRKADFHILNGFSEDYDYGLEDIDFCMRLRKEINKYCICINETNLNYMENATWKYDLSAEILIKDHQIFKKKWDNYIRDLIGKPLKKSDKIEVGEFNAIYSFEQILQSNKAFCSTTIPRLIKEQAELIVKKAQPKISVIVPTWNRETVISRALESVFNQTVEPFEVIVIDDGSTDHTVSLLGKRFSEEISRKKLYIIECQHQGVSKARNAGLKCAKGDVIAYIDSDNYWHEDHLLYLSAALYTRKDSFCAYSAMHLNNITSSSIKVICKKYDRDQLLRSNFIDLNTFIHKKEAYDLHGGFDENLKRLVDWELIIRYTKENNTILVPIITVEYFLEEKSLKNITFSEPLDINRDYIFIKHAEEYIARKILTSDQILSKKATYKKEFSKIIEKNLCLYIITSKKNKDFPELSGLDTQIKFLYLEDDYTFTDYYGSSSSEMKKYTASELPQGVFWWPDFRQPVPAVDQLRALFLTIALTRVDIAILSYDLNIGKTVNIVCLQNQMMVNKKLIYNLVKFNELDSYYIGKVLRIPPLQGKKSHRVELENIFGMSLAFDSNQYFWPLSSPEQGVTKMHGRDNIMLNAIPKKKKRILVLPMKLAVGGVERNTVEVIRSLKNKYDFIWTTMEKIYPEQGSLANQVMEVCWRLIDMAEIAEHSCYIYILQRLKSAYKPDLIWICNGSMWFCANALKIRELFAEIPIVDQQVYDVDHGWINRYQEKGIQSFDRFIAINSKIYQKFINDFGMNEKKIDLIYSSIDTNKFSSAKAEKADIFKLRMRFNLPLDKKIFVFMGRLVEQKRPQFFLEISRLRRTQKNEHYVLVGNGMLATQIKKWLNDNPSENIQWIDYINDTSQFWQAVDGLIVTSAYEGLPIAMLEALAMGVPVLATDVGDIRLVLEEHNAGTVIDSNCKPYQIANKIDDWKNKLEDYKNHLKIESDLILERFSAVRIASQYVQCWEQAMENKNNYLFTRK